MYSKYSWHCCDIEATWLSQYIKATVECKHPYHVWTHLSKCLLDVDDWLFYAIYHFTSLWEVGILFLAAWSSPLHISRKPDNNQSQFPCATLHSKALHWQANLLLSQQQLLPLHSSTLYIYHYHKSWFNQSHKIHSYQSQSLKYFHHFPSQPIPSIRNGPWHQW